MATDKFPMTLAARPGLNIGMAHRIDKPTSLFHRTFHPEEQIFAVGREEIGNPEVFGLHNFHPGIA